MNGSVVVDASFAFKWIVDEVYSHEARAMLSQWRSADTLIMAPSLFFYEIANALYRRVRRGEFTLREATLRFRELQRVGVQISPLAEDAHIQAMELAHRFGLPAAYDAHYLVLAERENCELWTADERMWNSVKSQIDWVRWIGGPSYP